MTLAWQEFDADTPRFVGTDRALLFGPGGTNLANNARGEGAVPGTPGTPATGISALTLLTLTEVGEAGVWRGVTWRRYRLTPTATGTNANRLQISTFSATSALPYTCQAFVAWPGAAPAGVSGVNLRVAASTEIRVAVTVPANGAVDRVNALFTANATASSALQLEFSTTTLDPFDILLGWIDIKQQEFLSNPVLSPVGSPGTAAIGADRLSAPLSSLGIGPSGSSTWWFDVTFPVLTGLQQRLLTLDDNSVANAVGLIVSASNNLQLRAVLASSATTVTVAAVSAGVRYGVAFRVLGDGTSRAVLHGIASANGTGGPTAGLLSARLSGSSAGTFSAFYQSRRVAYLPFAMDDATLDTLAAQAAAW